MQMKLNNYKFNKATPIWEAGTQKTMNRGLVFLGQVGCGKCTLALAGSSQYIVLVNDTLVAHGPARAAHGFYRVDELDLSSHTTLDANKIEIRIFGYNVNCFEYLDQPSFLCAELWSGDDIVAYTSAPSSVGFRAYGLDGRIMKSHRYSIQRAFVENYRLDENYFNLDGKTEITLEATEDKCFICRDLPYGDYDRIYPKNVFGRGTVSYSEKERYHSDRAITGVGDFFKGYREEELEYASYIKLGQMDFSERAPLIEDASLISVCSDTYVDIDMEKVYCGNLELEIEADGDGELFITFDELLVNGNLNCFRVEPSNIISLICKKGSYKLVSAEPYAMKYVRFTAKGANFKVKDFRLCEIAFPKSKITASFKCDDEVMKKIYDAAELTFRSNTVDIYFDCPSRERAGWLCDAFFLARAEHALTGKSEVEKQFLSNLIMPEELPDVPKGMLPMCYPSDHNHADPLLKYNNNFDGSPVCYIPSWAMFFGMELYEYLQRTGDRELIDCARDRMYSVCEYFKGFENEYGLLERLKSWVFVEWSHANDLVWDVSFPNNMLYSLFLQRMAELYGDEELAYKAEHVKNTINDMAMTESGFYCDNAVRRDGKLVLTGERTEVCQYYAFFASVATPETHPWLWSTLITDFGFERKITGKYPEIHPAKPFIGNYLRLDLLDRYGMRDVLYSNIKGYFENMANLTGTLWETEDALASCNHGFASHVAYWMKSMGIIE